MFKKLSKLANSNIVLIIGIILSVFILLTLVINNTRLMAETSKTNFLYTIKIRDTIEEVDKIVERAEVNLEMYAKTIYGPYDISQINNSSYNEEMVKRLDPLTALVLENSPGVTGVWFQYKVSVPFGNKTYSWYERQDGKYINLRDIFKDTAEYNREVNVKDDPYYFQAIAAKKMIWSNLYVDVDTNELFLSLAKPVYKNDYLIGVAGIDISVEDLTIALKNMQNNFEGSEIFLLDENKNIILSQVQPEDKKDETGYFFKNLFNNDQGKDQSIEYVDDGLKRTAILIPLSNKYYVVITFPNNIIYDGFDHLITLNYFIFLLLFILLSFGIASRIKIIKANKVLENEIVKIHSIINHAPTIICIKDKKGHYIDCNEKFAEITGLDKDEIIGKTDYELFDKETAELQVQNDAEVIKTKKFIVIEQWNISAHGEKRRLEKHKMPLFNAKGEIEGILVNAVDITKKHLELEHLETARETAEKTAKLKSNFLANMSHEIRTPLNGVLGFLQLLEDTNLDDVQKEFVVDAKKSSELLLSVLNEILDFSKIEAGKLQIDNISFNIRSIVEDVTVMNTTNACSKNIDINSLICSDVPQRVYGDPGRLKQILNNLINNAIKFTHKGDVTIYVNQLASNEDSTVISFKIKDTGIGITEDKLRLIFDSFSQADITTTRRYGGTGLGLSISQKLAEMMNGHISVESEAEKGSTFTLTMSFMKDLKHQNKNLNINSSLNGLNILLFHNNKNDSKIIRYYLNEANCRVIEAHTIDESLNIINNTNNISIMLVDYFACNESNIKIEDLLMKYPNLKNLPLILYTSLARKGDAIKAKEAGFKGFLTKPFKKSDLISTIETAVNNQNTNNELLTKHLIKEKKFDSKTKILVVEDIELNCKFITKLLSNMGLVCDIANDGREAIEALKKQNYDLVLMDCQMPIMDGYEATKKIRESQDDKQRNIPIIAMTANAMQSDREKCFKAGMTDYISKPIDKEKLFNILSKYIKFELQIVELSEEKIADNSSFFSQIIEKLIQEIGFTREETIQILNEFMEFLVQSILELDIAVEENHFDATKSIAHKLKGSSANLKIDKIAFLSAKIESAALNNDKNTCKSLITEMKEYLKSLNQQELINN